MAKLLHCLEDDLCRSLRRYDEANCLYVLGEQQSVANRLDRRTVDHHAVEFCRCLLNESATRLTRKQLRRCKDLISRTQHREVLYSGDLRGLVQNGFARKDLG